MGATKRKFKLEFRTEAAHRVIDTGRTVRDAAHELSVLENSLSKWVRDERRRMDAVAVASEVVCPDRCGVRWRKKCSGS